MSAKMKLASSTQIYKFEISMLPDEDGKADSTTHPCTITLRDGRFESVDFAVKTPTTLWHWEMMNAIYMKIMHLLASAPSSVEEWEVRNLPEMDFRMDIPADVEFKKPPRSEGKSEETPQAKTDHEILMEKMTRYNKTYRSRADVQSHVQTDVLNEEADRIAQENAEAIKTIAKEGLDH